MSVSTQADCAWTAAETVEWLSVSAPAGATGPGAFQVMAAANGNPATRTGAVVVSGLEVMFTQAGTGCGTFSVDPASRMRTLPHEASDADLGVVIDIGPGCPWSASASSVGSWLQVSNGSGPGPVRYTVSANTSAFERSGTLTVQGVAITIVQVAPPPPVNCTYTVSPELVEVGIAGGIGTFSVTASNASCPWSAHSEVGWIVPNGNAKGVGSGLFLFRVTEANGSGNRLGTVVVAGRTRDGPAPGDAGQRAVRVRGLAGGQSAERGRGAAADGLGARRYGRDRGDDLPRGDRRRDRGDGRPL